MTLVEPNVPNVDLPRVNAVQFSMYDHTVGAFLVTRDEDMARWIDELCSYPPAAVAADIETRGLDTNKFTITCVTVAFRLGEDTVSLLLDPLRRDEHRGMLTRVFDHADRLIFHGASFDIAPLYAHRLMTRAHIRKLGDTLVAARMLNTNAKAGRALEDLATKYKVMSDDRTTMTEVFAARGLKKDDGWWATDIDTPTYVVGAMSDTVATLRLWGTPGVHGDGIMAQAARYLTAHSYGLDGKGQLSPEAAEEVVNNVQKVNAIVLERTARGYAVDKEFPERFIAENEAKWVAAGKTLSDAGIRPGVGADLVKVLARRKELPEPWPRTPTGNLKADKKALEVFTAEHSEIRNELALAHRMVANSEKVRGYVEKVVENASATGRLHPEIKILGANATGRMSASRPEVQQFPKEARGVIVADDGSSDLISADWKSIEPVVMATASGDRQFIDDMRAGRDPYEPVGQMAGVARKPAKVIMLANMYGQGWRSLAVANNWGEDRAKQVLRDIRRSLPVLYRLIDALREQSQQIGRVTTLTGRVLDQHFMSKEGPDIASSAAANHFCQGSALDVMHHSILELDRRGLSDKVHLWMHDEIVGDKDIEEELVDVMSTPPAFLRAVADLHGIDPFLAVDVNPMGRRWEYV